MALEQRQNAIQCLISAFFIPAGNAYMYPSGHLVSSPFLGLAFAQIIETSFPDLRCFLFTFQLEYPAVLFRFCFKYLVFLFYVQRGMCYKTSCNTPFYNEIWCQGPYTRHAKSFLFFSVCHYIFILWLHSPRVNLFMNAQRKRIMYGLGPLHQI